MSTLWSKSDELNVDERLMRFMAADDVVLDRVLFRFDIEASIAHVQGLARIELLDGGERAALETELRALADAFEAGDFELDERFEDGHSAIEFHLTEQLGELGKKVHTGRSRNDQVLVATRLYLRDVLGQLEHDCLKSAAVFLERAKRENDLPMPGYTHLQRAMPSTAGMWMAAFAEAFVDNAQLVRDTLRWVDANPLGTAAGYGVNLPLDREYTTDALDFGRMQVSPIYAQNSRGKFELAAISALEQVLLDVRRLAWDLSLFTTSEFAFVDLPDRYMTGSSIMPQKRNPDVVELLRACVGAATGARAELVANLSLPSGYHRDLQNTKPPMIRAFQRGLAAVALIADIAADIEWQEEPMRAAVTPEMHATDIAIDAAARGVPFRDAYVEAAKSGLDSDRTPEDSIQKRSSAGGAANPRLDLVEVRLAEMLDSKERKR